MEIGKLPNVAPGAKVIIMSHDMDDYSVLSHVLRKDFLVSKVRAWYSQVGPDRHIMSGLRFDSFLGQHVDGYFSSPTAILWNEVLKSYNPPSDSLTIVQLIPDFASYRTLCRIHGDVSNNTDMRARAMMTDDAMAQSFSEESLINLCGVIMGMEGLRNNPILPAIKGASLRDHVARHKLLNSIEAISKFLAEVRASHCLVKTSACVSLNSTLHDSQLFANSRLFER